MKEERNIAVALILTIVTCGIYGIYWFIALSDDVKEYSGDNEMMSGGVAFLLTLLTCGLFGIYWFYKLGEAMKKAQEANGLPVTDNSLLYLILVIVGLSIVDYCLIQNDVNAITKKRKGVAPVEAQ